MTSEDTDTEEREWAEKEADFAKETKELERKLGEMAQAVGEAKKAAKESQKPELGVEEQQKVARAQTAVAEAQHQAEQVWKELEALRDGGSWPGRGGGIAGRRRGGGDLRNQKLAPLEEQVDDWATKPKEEFARADDIAEGKAWEAHHEAARLSGMERAFAAEDQAEVLAKDVDRAAARQREVAQASAEAQSQPESDRALQAVRDQQEIAGAQIARTGRGAVGIDGTDRRRRAESARQIGGSAAGAGGSGTGAGGRAAGPNQVRQQAEELKNRAEESARQMDAMRQALPTARIRRGRRWRGSDPIPARELATCKGKANELGGKREQTRNERNAELASRVTDEAAAVGNALCGGPGGHRRPVARSVGFRAGRGIRTERWPPIGRMAAQAADALANKVDEAAPPEAAKALAATPGR